MPQTFTIQEILKGYTVDRSNIQNVGNMTVIPIISDTEFTNVANVNEVTFKEDVDYNRLKFANSSGDIGITLQGWSIIESKQHAQDRTLPYAHLVKAGSSKLIPANCIQHTQAGHFDPKRWDQDDFMILPPSLRATALAKSSHRDSEVGALWNSLRSWVRGVDCNSNGLKSFYSKFEDRLEQFVAQFEPVEKQLGSVVLINNEIVAIDIVPKYDTWKRMWRTIIRDSYGGEAVRVAENEGAKVNNPVMDLNEINTIDDLDNCYEQMKNTFYNSVQGSFAQVAEVSVAYKKQEEIDELTLVKLTSQPFVGQGVLHGENHFVYLSLVTTSAKVKPKEKFQSLRREPYSNDNFSFTG